MEVVKHDRYKEGWIGVDLDGTLARAMGWKAGDPEVVIGPPIKRMLKRVRRWVKLGYEVRILTARAGRPTSSEIIPAIEAWCKKHIGRVLPITDKKDYDMIELWDDRAVQVELNTGRRIGNHVRGTSKKCNRHPRYKAKRRPIVKCQLCIWLWELAQN